MPSTALALDIGATTVCATVRDRNGRIANVRVDNSDTVPARLVVDRGTPRPPHGDDAPTIPQLGSVIDRLDVASTVIDGVAWSADTLLAILLDPILSAAAALLGSPPAKIMIVVPFWWDHDRQRRFQLTIHAALRRPVVMVPSDKAFAYSAPSPAVGAHRIVIDCGASALAAVMVGGGTRGPRIAATAAVEDGGDIFDRILLANALTAADHSELALDARWAFAGVPRIRAGREALSDVDAVAVALPKPVGPITLSSEDVDETGAEFFVSAFGELFRSLDATHPEAADVREQQGLLLCGGLAYDPAISSAVRAYSSRGARVMPHPQHTLCRGALAFGSADYDSTHDPDPLPAKRAEVDDIDTEIGVGRGWSRRTLAVYGGLGVAAVAVAVAGGLALSSSMTGPADLRASDLQSVAAAVLPAEGAIAGTTMKTWTDGVSRSDPTMRTLTGDRLETLACGGGRLATDGEGEGIRLEATRIFIDDGDTDPATTFDQFDSSATTNVTVTAAIVARDQRDQVWSAIHKSNERCTSTKDDLVRTIVAIPQDGPDPGPPTYSENLPGAQLPTSTAATPSRTSSGSEQGGVTMSTQRQAWRGLVPAAASGSDTDMHVTCVLDIDGVVLRRSCATAKSSAKADTLAQTGAAAFNPAPESAK